MIATIIGRDDFLLAFQTEYQRDMMMKYSDQVVCMDDTHGTNMYDFSLITVLVIDDHGEGIPVAWALANRVDAAMLREFLKPLRKRVGSVNPKIFMSDMADQFFTAWIGVFGVGETKHLYCTWHVDKAWRKGLAANVEGKQDRIELYHHLRVLLQETDEATFQVLLQQFLSHVLQSYPQFSTYFHETYVPCTSKWAFCFRKGAAVNTNMFVEAFHRKLKTVYFQKKQNRRVDKLVYTLLKIARDLIFEGLCKDEIGKRSHRKCEIRKRCQTALEMKRKGVTATPTSDSTWDVSSCTSGVFYTVHLSKESCDCHLRCPTCGACVHMYVCSCVDHAVHYTVCKHTHLVHLQQAEKDEEELHVLQILTELYNGEEPGHEAMQEDSQTMEIACEIEAGERKEIEEDNGVREEADNSRRQSYECTELENTSDVVAEHEEGDAGGNGHEREDSSKEVCAHSDGVFFRSSMDLMYYSGLLKSSSKVMSLVSSKQIFEEKISELQLLVNSCSSHEIINTVCSHLTSAITVVKASSTMESPISSSLTVRKRPAPNSNSEKQLRFHSTKKRRAKISRWAKPNTEEEDIARKKMANTQVEVCGICMKQDDNRDGVEVDWIECAKCKLWVHSACIDSYNDDSNTDFFVGIV